MESPSNSSLVKSGHCGNLDYAIYLWLTSTWTKIKNVFTYFTLLYQAVEGEINFISFGAEITWMTNVSRKS